MAGYARDQGPDRGLLGGLVGACSTPAPTLSPPPPSRGSTRQQCCPGHPQLDGGPYREVSRLASDPDRSRYHRGKRPPWYLQTSTSTEADSQRRVQVDSVSVSPIDRVVEGNDFGILDRICTPEIFLTNSIVRGFRLLFSEKSVVSGLRSTRRRTVMLPLRGWGSTGPRVTGSSDG